LPCSIIDNYLKNPEKDPKLNDGDLLLRQISAAIKQLDKDFPTYSQIRLIETLLRLSESRADTLRLRRDELEGMYQTTLMPKQRTPSAIP